MDIINKRGKWVFRDKDGVLRKFEKEEDAKLAAGIKVATGEKDAVSQQAKKEEAQKGKEA